MENCIFCKIVSGEIPSAKVYEDEKLLAFLDINPVSDGHLLVITKDHYPWMQDVPDNLISEVFVKIKNIMAKMKDALPCDYVQLSVVGKDIPHFHAHLMPRYFNDDLHGWPTKKYKEGEIESLSEKIKASLQ